MCTRLVNNLPSISSKVSFLWSTPVNNICSISTKVSLCVYYISEYYLFNYNEIVMLTRLYSGQRFYSIVTKMSSPARLETFVYKFQLIVHVEYFIVIICQETSRNVYAPREQMSIHIQLNNCLCRGITIISCQPKCVLMVRNIVGLMTASFITILTPESQPHWMTMAILLQISVFMCLFSRRVMCYSFSRRIFSSKVTCR